MAGDRDLSSLLPDTPPPRPARREAAIDAALRRFDGVPDVPPVPSRPAAAPWWRALAGPQLGAVTAILLVMLVAVPVWMLERDRIVPPAPREAAPAPAASASPAASPAAPATAEVDAVAQRPEPKSPMAGTSNAPSARAVPSAAPDASVVAGRAAQMAPAPVAEAEIVVAARRREEAIQDAPVAVTAVTSDSLAPAPASKSHRFAPPPSVDPDDGAGEMVVTATRINRKDARAARAAARRGDWNACTIDDPRQSLDACRRRVDPATPLGDGIARAWRGDLDGAIAAFDRAVAEKPRKAAPWLNRALAYARRGEEDKALADIDRAIRIEPGAARNFYYRSVILRRAGETRRADRDAERAVEMDSRYRDLIP